ncbi:unnamed protein product [Callosobruchus maculatus]|uniref:Peptidase S1 domain-containing protein n=1 Tax=Callosobruchus maculatus TaxID=64391 RepID=A0A653DFS3_CALMS|nr:unnamed protein product [Callosobruchus maculatus]
MVSNVRWICSVLLILGLYRDITGLNDEIKYHKNWKLLPGLSSCGKVDVNERIIGGSSAKLGQYPWIASLKEELSSRPFCGASLINENHVLTAAHCVEKIEDDCALSPWLSVRNYHVRLGEHDWTKAIDCEGSLCAPAPTDYRILNAITHPDYTHSTHSNDIALVKFEGRATYNTFVQPICLPQGQLLSPYRLKGHVIVAGWGRTKPNDLNSYSDVLRHVELPVVPLKQCEKVEEMSEYPIDEHQYCVGVKNKGSCHGDSGGPMMKSLANVHSRNYFLFGIVSYGPSICAEYPAVYTNVAMYMKWILDKLSD